MYPTHQFFLTYNCTYIVVFNVMKVDESRIEYWMRQLKLLLKNTKDDDNSSNEAAIYIVGTHIDDELCTQQHVAGVVKKLQEKYRKSSFPNLRGIFTVSCKTGQGIHLLKEELFTLFSNSKINVPVEWVRLHDYIKEQANFDTNDIENAPATTASEQQDGQIQKRTSLTHREHRLQYISWEVFKQWCGRCNIDEEEILILLEFLCDFGSLIHLKPTTQSEDNHSDDLVVLNPQWLSNVMSCIISIRTSNWIKDGILTLDKIPLIFSEYDPHIHDSLLKILQKFEIVYKMRKMDQIIIPSLLPSDTQGLSQFWPAECSSEVIEIGRVIKFPFLPVGFFSRLIVHLLHNPQLKILFLWKYGIVLRLYSKFVGQNRKILVKKDILAYAEFDELKCELILKARFSTMLGFTSGNRNAGLALVGTIIRIIEECISTLIEGFKLSYDVERKIICYHCLKNNCKLPYHFNFHEMISSLKSGKVFVFCQNIPSPSRCVQVSLLAPDISFLDIVEINPSSIVRNHLLGQGSYILSRPSIFSSIFFSIFQHNFLIIVHDIQVLIKKIFFMIWEQTLN